MSHNIRPDHGDQTRQNDPGNQKDAQDGMGKQDRTDVVVDGPPTVGEASSGKTAGFAHQQVLRRSSRGRSSSSSSAPDPHAHLFHREVEKVFDGHGFKGTVVRLPDAASKWFQVRYVDGDEEEFNLCELRRHLVPLAEGERDIGYGQPHAPLRCGPPVDTDSLRVEVPSRKRSSSSAGLETDAHGPQEGVVPPPPPLQQQEEEGVWVPELSSTGTLIDMRFDHGPVA